MKRPTLSDAIVIPAGTCAGLVIFFQLMGILTWTQVKTLACVTVTWMIVGMVLRRLGR